MLLSIFTQSIVHIYIVEHIKLDIVYILMGFALPTSAMSVTQALTQCDTPYKFITTRLILAYSFLIGRKPVVSCQLAGVY